MKKNKLKFIIICSTIILLLSSCSKDVYIDRHELSQRLKDVDASHYFDPQTAIIKNTKQYIFLSLLNEDDCLLTLQVDSSDHIKSFSLTLDSKDFNSQNIESVLLPFYSNILNSFLQDEKIADKAIKNLSVFSKKIGKQAYYKTVDIEKFKFSFFVNELSIVFECAYK